MSEKKVHPVATFMGALFWLFIFWIIYVIFIWDNPQEVSNIKEDTTISMEEAINILDNNLSTPKKEEPEYQSQIEERASKIIKTLKDVYNIDIEKERHSYNNYYQMETTNEAIEKRVVINFLGHLVEVLTQPNIEDKTLYFNTCNAIFMTLLNTTNITETEESLFKMFSDTSETTKRQTWKVENIEVIIKPDSTGLLGCQFYKNLRDD